MKKIVLIFGWAALFTQFSMADEIAVENQAIENDSACDRRDDHNGLYGGIGFAVTHTKDRATLKETRGSGPVNPGTNFNYVARDGVVGSGEVAGNLAVLGMLNGNGISASEITAHTTNANGLTSAISWRGIHNNELIKETSNNIKGWAVFGYGHMFGNAYAGAEISCDIGANTDHATTSGKIKQSGLIPAIAARFGAYAGGVLVYVKAGYASPKVTAELSLENGSATVDARLDSPILGIGVERGLNGCVVRAEIEHRLKTKKNKTISTELATDPFGAGLVSKYSYDLDVNLKSEGTTLRVAVVRNVKF
ncbi:MAG: hypothetical protein LBJ71_05415 [Holosporaceae bacterium]|jgi:hypothetical protein|nr:hypothetical protein [Holosporaceae bacterium]